MICCKDRAETLARDNPPPKARENGRFFEKITDVIGDFLSSHKKGFSSRDRLLVILSGSICSPKIT
jgi:hypothetical protein